MAKPRLILWLLLIVGALALVGQAVPLYTDWLWFQEVGYAGVFVTILSLRGWLFIGVGLGTFLFLYLNLTLAARTARPDALWELEDQLGLPSRAVLEPLIRRLLLPVLAVVSFFSGVSASGNWETVLEYFNATPFDTTDPLFNRDLSFYVFTLPFWRLLYGWAMLLLTATMGLGLALYVLQRSLVLTARGPRLAAGARAHLLLLGTALLGFKAWGFWLDRFDLLFSPRGVVFGASYSDVNASLPVLGILAALALLCAAACLFQVWRPGWRFLAAGLVVLAAMWVGGLGAYPALLQRFRVTPNELVAEGPYIIHNIRMTRKAFGLERIEEKDFPAEENLTAAALERNNPTIKNIRLWDHRPLLVTFGQLQEIRTYYKFTDVDNDRYLIGGEYRQIMLSPRELSYRHLPSRIWINEHLTYTHGYGVIVGPVNRISPEGLPEFFVKDIPPVSTGFPKITRPEIYYGEISNDYVFVRTKSQELDYPAGDQNVYTRYAGRGGIPVTSFLTKLAFAIRFGEIKIVLSDDLTGESRIMIHREVAKRVRQIAPFLRFDRDPYLVITDDGRLVWMIDGYTVSDRYPYSQPVRDLGNYIRNSVKATVDAYHGTVTFYLADPADPIIRTYARAFPGLFKPLGDMPADLQRHIRYPEDLFSIQAKMFATYHMEDPQVFYNKEDLWAIPRRTVEGRDREMEPYYTIMRLPGEKKEEFILLTLFNPSRRDNMIAWLAARTDPPNYGRLVVYNFPKAKLVYGPRQIDARIDQDPNFSQQLSLWNQRGSVTLRGSLLAIPIDQSLIYVQPLYLAASEQGALPELRRVFVAYGNQIAMEPTLEQSLQRIFGGRARVEDGPRPAPAAGPPAVGDALRGVAQRAWEAWSRAQEALRRGDWSAYGEEQRRLEQALREFRERSGR
ncbi:MAG: hypothetical protein XU13_C0010G0009 [Candidatus Rokubacteria bacterium CSP1-6]|nr:MAG: hypothetical protein XU13_C0010G0009 [Candidatus Rokubacteria bacterium CSP1-6]